MTFSILFLSYGYMTSSNQTANYWTVSGIVGLVNLFTHFWKLWDAKLLHYAVLLFPYLSQKEPTTVVSGLYINDHFFCQKSNASAEEFKQ